MKVSHGFAQSFFCAAAFTSYIVSGCLIQGYDSGICSPWSDNIKFMKYCGNIVTYEACIPRYNPLWPNHTLEAKDEWVGVNSYVFIETRKSIENNDYYQENGNVFISSSLNYTITNCHSDVNELGEEGAPAKRFWEEDMKKMPNDCELAFKNYMCWMNFPRFGNCDTDVVFNFYS